MNGSIPHMGYNEIVYMLSHMHRNCSMLEIGTGNSTPFFAKFVKKLTAIEHNLEWSNKVQEMLSENGSEDNVEFLHIEPNWPHSHPFKPAEPGQFENYVNRIKEMDNESFDIILVDGRDRVNCTKAAVHALKTGGKLFIHDYWNRRSKYGEVEEIKELKLLNLDMKADGFTLVAFEKI